MLWWMFDESYQHSRETGHATEVTIAGGVATAGAWYSLAMEWATVLDKFRLPHFHMTDFEANKKKFKGWRETPDRRRDLLEKLLEIGTRHVCSFWGVVREVGNAQGKQAEAYRLCLNDLVADLSRDLYPRYQKRFALVFARQTNFRSLLIHEAIGREHPERFGPVTCCDPISMCPLQFADIIAFETRCIQRAGQSERYPFRRLRDSAGASNGIFTLSRR